MASITRRFATCSPPPAARQSEKQVRSIQAARQHLLTMLQMLRKTEAINLVKILKSSDDDAAVMGNLLLAVAYYSQTMDASHAARLRTRLRDLLPLSEVDVLDIWDAPGGDFD